MGEICFCLGQALVDVSAKGIGEVGSRRPGMSVAKLGPVVLDSRGKGSGRIPCRSHHATVVGRVVHDAGRLKRSARDFYEDAFEFYPRNNLMMVFRDTLACA